MPIKDIQVILENNEIESVDAYVDVEIENPMYKQSNIFNLLSHPIYTALNQSGFRAYYLFYGKEQEGEYNFSFPTFLPLSLQNNQFATYQRLTAMYIETLQIIE